MSARASARTSARRGSALLVLVVLLVVVIGLAYWFGTSRAPRTRPGIPPRHLVLVTCQAFRADRSSTWLHARPTTHVASDPLARKEGRAMGFDDLAASGVVFARAFAPSCRTVPVLASLFTGRSPIECGVTSDLDVVPDELPTLAELFDHAGFRTAAFVTQRGHALADSPQRGLALEESVGRGFATFETHATDRETLAAAAAYAKRDPADGAREFTWIHLAGLEPPFDAALGSEWVEEQLAQRDFGALPTRAEVEAWIAGRAPIDEAARAALGRAYDRELTRTSHALAESLRTTFDYYQSGADTSENWARSVFAFVGTTGVLLGEENLVGHAGTVHEHALHVPLVLRHPDSLTGERVLSAVVEHADLLPTFVEWFDLATPERVQGRSLLALVDSYQVRPFVRRPAIAALDDRLFSARDERFHAVVLPFGRAPVDRPVHARALAPLALYEPERDPLERDDVADEFPYTEALLRNTLDRVLRRETKPYPPEKRRRIAAAPPLEAR